VNAIAVAPGEDELSTPAGPPRSPAELAPPGGGTTRTQISGYNFLVRRMEHAIVRRDVRMLFDPMRSQSRAFTVGIILAALGLAGMGVLALIHPQDKIGDNKILIGADSGQLYVVLGNTIHPALNLASARLALGAPDKPATINESQLAKHPLGQLIGIPGAPSSMPRSADGSGTVWTVCDNLRAGDSNALTTSVIVGPPQLGGNAAALDPTHVLLARAIADQSDAASDTAPVYLVYDGKRALVNPKNSALMNGLGIAGAVPRTVSRGLLNAIPEVPQLTVPQIGGMHNPPSMQMTNGMGWPAQDPIGWVVYTTTSGVKQFYVVLDDGLQKISEATASIILAENNQNDAGQISQTMAANAPASTRLDAQLADYPRAKPQVVDAPDTTPVACLSWKPLATLANRAQSAIGAQLAIFTGRALPVDPNAKPITLIQPIAGSGDAGDKHRAGETVRADTVYLRPGSGDYVQTTGIEPTSQRSDNLLYVADTGVVYGIDQSPVKDNNTTAVKALGLDGVAPEPAPDQIVALLAAGPTLSRKAAMVAHDGLSPDRNAVPLPDTATATAPN
jgi:type VII secretion protein EccB